jgi:hypothetical protein
MKQVIFLNGPAGSGKDSIADYLAINYGYTHLSFKDVLFDWMFKIFNIPDNSRQAFFELYYTRTTKELPCELLRLGNSTLSPRQALIHVSENVVKPMLGSTYFGDVVAAKIANSDADKFVLSDCGFKQEILPVCKVADLDVLCRIQRDGCSFEGDSRSYVYGAAAHEYVITNNSTIPEAANQVLDMVGLISMHGSCKL